MVIVNRRRGRKIRDKRKGLEWDKIKNNYRESSTT